MSEYYYAIEYLKKGLKEAKGLLKSWKKDSRKLTDKKWALKYWEKAIAQLESAIKKLKGE